MFRLLSVYMLQFHVCSVYVPQLFWLFSVYGSLCVLLDPFWLSSAQIPSTVCFYDPPMFRLCLGSVHNLVWRLIHHLDGHLLPHLVRHLVVHYLVGNHILRNHSPHQLAAQAPNREKTDRESGCGHHTVVWEVFDYIWSKLFKSIQIQYIFAHLCSQ